MNIAFIVNAKPKYKYYTPQTVTGGRNKIPKTDVRVSKYQVYIVQLICMGKLLKHKRYDPSKKSNVFISYKVNTDKIW